MKDLIMHLMSFDERFNHGFDGLDKRSNDMLFDIDSIMGLI